MNIACYHFILALDTVLMGTTSELEGDREFQFLVGTEKSGLLLCTFTYCIRYVQLEDIVKMASPQCVSRIITVKSNARKSKWRERDARTRGGNERREREARTRRGNETREREAGTRRGNERREREAGTRRGNETREREAGTRGGNGRLVMSALRQLS
jgi:hypothetical protein